MALQREEDRVEQKAAEVGELQRRLLGMEAVMVVPCLQSPALGQEGTHGSFPNSSKSIPSQQPCTSILMPSGTLGMKGLSSGLSLPGLQGKLFHLRLVLTQMSPWVSEGSSESPVTPRVSSRIGQRRQAGLHNR